MTVSVQRSLAIDPYHPKQGPGFPHLYGKPPLYEESVISEVPDGLLKILNGPISSQFFVCRCLSENSQLADMNQQPFLRVLGAS